MQVVTNSMAEAQGRLEDEIVHLICDKQGLTEQRQSDQAEIQQMHNTIADLQQAVDAFRLQPSGIALYMHHSLSCRIHFHLFRSRHRRDSPRV